MGLFFFKEIIAYAIAAGVIAGIWAIFYKLASALVDVNIMDDTVVFKTAKNSLSIEPYLYISTNRRLKRILGVGRQVMPREPHVKVNLTKYGGEIGGEKEYYECVSAFFRFSFCKVMNRHFFLLPTVTVTGAEKFQRNFPNTKIISVCQAIKDAGAKKCNLI